MSIGNCPICLQGNAEGNFVAAGVQTIGCPRCGRFEITEEAGFDSTRAKWSGRQRASASSYVFEHQGLKIDRKTLGVLASVRLPNVDARALKLLRMISSREKAIGLNHAISFGDLLGPEYLAASWSETSDEVDYLLQSYLGQNKYIDVTTHKPQRIEFVIAPEGYKQLYAQQGAGNSAMGFCAMWFAPEVQPLWDEAISPAIERAGYEPKRVDRHEHNNKIDDEIVALIRISRFLVADFTGHRGGVYFEAGFAQGLGIPVIWLVREDALDDVHFDTRQYNFIRWTQAALPECRDRLRDRIVATIGQGPISV